jgi:hypothetical protein
MAEKVIGFKIQIEGLAGTIETATQLKRQIADINAELKKTADVEEIKKLEKKLIDLKAAQSLVNDVTREQVKLRKEEIAGIDKSQGAYRKLSKELNDQRNRYKDLAAAQQDNTQEAKDLLISINKLDKELKGIDATVGQFQRNVGGYTEALSNFFPKLGGTFGQVTGAIGGLSMGITQLGQTTGKLNIGLGAIGIALTAFSAISEIFTSINQSVEETKKLSEQVSNFTGATGKSLDDAVIKSRAIANTYQKDVDEIVIAANSASKALGISFGDALDIVEVGFRKGADSQGQFLDGLREYSVQFKDAGLSAEDFLRVSIAASNEGIFSDKGLDSVKEFGLKIKEQTDGTKDALTNAFGEEFTSELFNNINNGSVTSGEAFGLVTQKINDTGIAGKELQTVITDVFGSPGEDIGVDLLITLGKVLQSTEDITKSTNRYQSQQELLYQSNLELEESQNDLNKSFANAGAEFTIIENKAKIFFNNLLGDLINLANEFPAVLKSMGAGLTTFFTTFDLSQALKVNRDVFRAEKKKIDKEDEEDIKVQQKKAEEAARKRLQTQAGLEAKISELKNKRKNILFDPAELKKIDAEIKQFEKQLGKFNPTETFKNKGKDAGESFAKEFTVGSIAALENERGKLQSAFSNAVAGSGTQKELAVKLNAINIQIKDAVEQQNQILADASRGNLLKNLQQAQQLTTLPLSLKPLKSIKQSDLDKKEAEDIKKVQQDVIKSSDEANKIRIDKENKAQQELYENRQKNIALAGEGAMALTNLFSTIQSAKFKKDADILNEEIRKTEESIATLEAKAEKASGLKKKRLEKEIIQEKALLEEKNKAAEALQLKAAKDEKKIAIIQSIIQGALAVQRALSFPPGPPATIGSAIATGVLSAIQTATIIAQPLAEGGVVTGQRVNQKQNIPTRSNGDNVLAYVKRGEVVLNQRQQSLLGGSPTFRRIGIKGFAEGGLVPPISAPIQAISGNNDLSNFLQVIEAKTDAINNRIDRLQAYVVSDDIARDLAEGNKLKVKATL